MSSIQLRYEHTFPKQERPIVCIGAGGIMRDAHLPAYRKAGFDVVGITDLNAQKAGELAKAFDIPNVYESTQGAVTAAPENAVFDIAVPASALIDLLPLFPEGVGILMQKPMGEDIKQAKQIRAICQERKFTAAVNFQMRFAPQVIAARNLIDAGHIGDLHDIEMRVSVYTPWHLWDFLQTCPRVEILYHSIHYIDLVRAFFGDPTGIYAKTLKHPKMMQMAAVRSNIIMDYGEVKRANITANHGHEYGLKHQESYLKFEGTQGAIKIIFGLLMDYPEGTDDAFEYCILKDDASPAWVSETIEGTWFPDAFIGIMSSLMQKLEDPTAPLPTAVDDAYKTMACVEAAYRSSTSGGTPITD
jgi:predicted dehydrogenase